MSTLKVEQRDTKAQHVKVTEDTLTVDLLDGRTISVPLAWFPRLLDATTKERANWRLIARGEGIHWSDLDEDISIDGLLQGRPSGESQTSLAKWLQSRRKSARQEPHNRPLQPPAQRARRG